VKLANIAGAKPLPLATKQQPKVSLEPPATDSAGPSTTTTGWMVTKKQPARKEPPMSDLIEAPPERLVKAFWERVTVGGDGDCWPWSGCKAPKGYGTLHDWRTRKNIRAHRLAYRIANGSIPEGMMICHTCDNPPCCNPKHLFAGTNQDNVNDRDRKGRFKMPPHIVRKFSDADVIAIRADARSNYAIAADWGVDATTIRRIRVRQSYRHVQSPLRLGEAP